ncbi:MAG: CPBP family intramembrane glutamic endopeptidase [Bacteroidota bacterium]
MNGIIDILILCLLVTVCFLSGFSKEKDDAVELSERQRKKRSLKGLLYMICIPLGFYVLSPQLFDKPDFEKLGKGIVLGDILIDIVTIMVTTHLLLELLPDRARKKLGLERNAEKERETIGFKRLPKNNSDLLLLTLFLLIAALVEELICRQFMFYSFNRVFNWKGDMLVIVSSVLFTLAHQLDLRKTSVLFFSGLVLGKLYQQTGSIWCPAIVHFLINFPIVLIAARRIRRLKSSKQQDLHPSDS